MAPRMCACVEIKILRRVHAMDAAPFRRRFRGRGWFDRRQNLWRRWWSSGGRLHSCRRWFARYGLGFGHSSGPVVFQIGFWPPRDRLWFAPLFLATVVISFCG